MVAPDQAAATRAFIRNFNILVKQAGIYGLQHQISLAQFELTWKELRTALEQHAAIQIALAGDRLLLNGTQLNPGAAERSLVQLFLAARISGLQFRQTLTGGEFAKLVGIFATAKPADLLAQLKNGLDHSAQASIQILETRFMTAAPEGAQGSTGAVSGLTGAVAGAVPAPPLDQQFWTAVPESHKRQVLLSADAWCVPARHVRSYIEELIQSGDSASAFAILSNYLGLLDSPEADAAQRTVAGAPELAGVFAKTGTLLTAIQRIGKKLTPHGTGSGDAARTAFVRLSRSAADAHDYPALLESMALLEKLAPDAAQPLRKEIDCDGRMQSFVGEAAGAEAPPAGLIEILQKSAAAAKEIITQFNACTERRKSERLASLLTSLPPEALEAERQKFRSGSVQDRIEAAGILSRIDLALAEEVLPGIVGAWDWRNQHALVRQIAAGGAPDRGRLLARLLGVLHPLALPRALDEIGMSGRLEDPGKLLDVAQGGELACGSMYLQVKGIEALVRLGVKAAVPLCARLLTAKRTLGWEHPRELRIAAAQALLALDPQGSQKLVAESGLSAEELRLRPLAPETIHGRTRYRRYERVAPARTLPAVAKLGGVECRIAVERLSLGGGFGSTALRDLKPAEAEVELQVSFRPVRCHALISEVRPHQVSFEILQMDLEDRSKLRRFLTQQANVASA